ARPPVDWPVGEAAASLAVFCHRAQVSPQAVLERHDLVRRFQLLLLEQGIPLYWYDDVPLEHPAFAPTQLVAIDGAWEGDSGTLHFAPGDGVAVGEGKQRVAAVARSLQKRRGAGAIRPGADALTVGPEGAALPLRWGAATRLVPNAVP